MSQADYIQGQEDMAIQKASEIARLSEEKGRLQAENEKLRRENIELIELLRDSAEFHAALVKEIEELTAMASGLFPTAKMDNTLSA